MNIIIDLDLQIAVQGFGSHQVALPYQVKSQDTPTVAIYFVRGNVTYDLGSSPGLRFAVFVAGNPNPLVQQNTFTRTTDNLGRTLYVAYPNFNTVQMQAAIGSQPQISTIGEIRYQTTYGTIARTADIPFTVVRSLLTETVMDNLIAAFTVPAVNANVTARINNTGWLSAGLNISIGAGAGAYQVVSVTNVTDFIAKNLGGTSNAASGTTIPSGTAVGIAPANVLQAYPDPSIIEVTTHKDVLNGYAGLDSTGLLKGTEMPVDGTTIAVSGGKLTVVGGGGGAPGQNAYTQTSASFVVPAVGATVSVTVGATAWMGATGYVVFITGAGYYTVSSITDATHAVLTNMGGTSNTIAGTTVPSGATVAAAGPAGVPGTAGTPGAALSAYDALSASFNMPAPAANVTITIANTAWLGAGQAIYIASAGYFQVASVSNATQALVTNLLYSGNASAGATIASGSKVSPGGLQGPQGAGGPGLNAFTTLSANYVQPAINATVTVNVATTAWMAAGLGIFITGGGYYTVTSISDISHAVVTNLGGASNIAAGSTVTGSGTQLVSPAGIQGTAGTDAFTVTIASFTQPTSGGTVTVTVGNTAWMAQGQNLYIPGAGYYSVSVVTDSTHVVLSNSGVAGSATAGTTIASGSKVSPAGSIGPTGPTGPSGPTGGIGEAPTDGQIYGRQSSAWTVVTGAGGGPIYPSARIFDFDDFDGSIQTAAQPNGKLGWLGRILASGSIASASNQGLNTTDKAQGVWVFTGSTTGDWASISLGDYTGAGGAKAVFVPGLGVLQLEFRMNIGALPSGSQDLMINCGLCNNATAISTVGPNDGVFFTYWFGGAITNWQARTVAGGTATNSSTGVAATATGWHKFQILTNATWTSIQFLIDGVVKATNTTNVPTNNLCPFFRAGNLSSVTWASSVYADYYYHDYQYTR